MTENQFNEITQWQRETFSTATPLSKIAHLKQEITELEVAICEKPPSEVMMEFADCFFLLFGAAAAWGLNYEEICELIDKKFEVNKSRKWGKPDKDGVVNHIKQTQP